MMERTQSMFCTLGVGSTPPTQTALQSVQTNKGIVNKNTSRVYGGLIEPSASTDGGLQSVEESGCSDLQVR